MFELKNFSVTYPDLPVWILQDICFTQKLSGCLGLIGENGSGKTTLAAAIAGIIPEYIKGCIKGTALLNGEDLSSFPLSKRLKQVAYVLQDFESQILFGSVENILGINEKDTCKVTLYKAIELLKIGHLLQRTPDSLSSGELQRIVLVASLRSNPSLLIYDEVTSVLDPLLKQELKKYIEWLSDMGKCTLLMGQRFSLLSLYTHRIYKIANHSIVPGDFKETCGVNADWTLLDGRKLLPACGKNVLVEKLLLTREKNGCSFCLDIEGLALSEGETVAILGINGSGKTTFFNLLYGLMEAECFQVVWGTKKYLNNRKAEFRKAMDYVMHNPYYGITCNTVLEELESVGASETCIQYVFALFPFLCSDVDPYNLSFGQLKMLSFLQGILRNKSFLCLDEPEYGLDARNYAMMQQYLQYNCSKRTRTILFSTHDLELAKKCSNRILLFKEGKICAVEETETIDNLYLWFMSHYED